MFFSLTVLAQRTYLNGVVKDSLTGQDMLGVHIKNINASSLTSSNAYGKFRIPVQFGDTLVFSNVGYKTISWVLGEDLYEQAEIEFFMRINTVYLDEVIIGDFPEYERFKEMILEAQPKDTSMQIFGVDPVVMTGDKRLDESYIRNPLFAALHPIDFVYQNFSKREKEKRKHYKLIQNQHITEKVNAKFTREWVQEMTNLEGDKLTSFIAFCKFETAYLAKTPLYMINERMVELMPAFLKQYEGN